MGVSDKENFMPNALVSCGNAMDHPEALHNYETQAIESRCVHASDKRSAWNNMWNPLVVIDWI